MYIARTKEKRNNLAEVQDRYQIITNHELQNPPMTKIWISDYLQFFR